MNEKRKGYTILGVTKIDGEIRYLVYLTEDQCNFIKKLREYKKRDMR